MNTLKGWITTFVLTIALMLSPTVSSAGTIIGGRSNSDGVCGETKPEVIATNAGGTIIGGLTGTIIGGFAGTIIGGLAGTIIGGKAGDPSGCGTIIGG